MSNDDDWETDADFENNATESEQRWGKGGDRGGAIDMQKLREETGKADDDKKKKLIEESGLTGRHGYGGKFGVEKDRMDKSALGHDYVGKVEKHASQKDYSAGFGGKFGVEKEKMDKSAVGFDYVGKVEKHDSQADYKKGFGGKFGVESDRMDKSAHTFQEQVEKVGTNYQRTKPDIAGAKPSNLKSRFENISLHNEEATKERAEMQKKLRQEKDKLDKEQATKEHTVDEPSKEKPQRARSIVTGRNEKISDVINVFNAPPPTDEFKPAPKQPIKLPKEEKAQVVPAAVAAPAIVPAPVVVATPEPVKPDIISSTEQRNSFEQPEITQVSVPEPEKYEEQSYEPEVEHFEPPQHFQQQPDLVEPPQQFVEPHRESNGASEAISEEILIEQLKNDTAEVEEEPEQFVLSPDNPGVTAYALYDYQAAADDEISFDPDDLITHIDMIDSGWWKGLHAKTFTYGLFPANYVQLRE